MTLNLTPTAGSRTEQELVAAARRGDDRAFAELYSRYRERIEAFVLARLGDHARAEDVAQEVFISALRRLRATDQPVAFKPWIYEIAKNASIDEFRRLKRTREVSLDASEELTSDRRGLLSAAPTPPAAAESRQRLQDLQGAFGGLSESQHQLLVMREFEGLSYDAIGARTGMTRQMVESSLFRARRKLTQEYDELASGRRCQQIQAMIGEGRLSARELGIRERRRFSRHLAHCQPCRHIALMSGVDESLVTRRRVSEKIAALLPLGILRRLWGGRGLGRSAASGGPHSVAAAGASAGAAAPAATSAAVGPAAAAIAVLALAGGGGVLGGLGGGHSGSHPAAHANSASAGVRLGFGAGAAGLGAHRAVAEPRAAGHRAGTAPAAPRHRHARRHAGPGHGSPPVTGGAPGSAGGPGAPSRGQGGGPGGSKGAGPAGVPTAGRPLPRLPTLRTKLPPTGTIPKVPTPPAAPVPGPVAPLVNGGTNLLNGATHGLQSTVNGVGGTVKRTVGNLTGSGSSGGGSPSGPLAGAGSVVSGAGSAVSHVGSVVSGSGPAVSHVVSGAGSAVSHAGSGAGSAVSHAGSGAGSAVSHVGSGAGSAVSHVGSALSGAASTVTRVASVASGAVPAVSVAGRTLSPATSAASGGHTVVTHAVAAASSPSSAPSGAVRALSATGSTATRTGSVGSTVVKAATSPTHLAGSATPGGAAGSAPGSLLGGG